MGHIGSKTRSLGEIFQNLLYVLEAIFFSHIPMKLSQNVASMICGGSLKMGHIGFKTRSLGPILEKFSVCS